MAAPAPAAPDDITTIFVVGFPDDMQEREFVNMFVFSKGFEAATLKVPSLTGNGTNIGTTTSGIGSGTGSGVTLTTTSTTGSITNSNAAAATGAGIQFASATASLNLASTSGMSGQGNEEDVLFGSSRRQTIGFAKFRTRQEALDARDILSGRRVDAGSVLKAEMAKKNLHTKRGPADQTSLLAGVNVAMMVPPQLPMSVTSSAASQANVQSINNNNNSNSNNQSINIINNQSSNNNSSISNNNQPSAYGIGMQRRSSSRDHHVQTQQQSQQQTQQPLSASYGYSDTYGYASASTYSSQQQHHNSDRGGRDYMLGVPEYGTSLGGSSSIYGLDDSISIPDYNGVVGSFSDNQTMGLAIPNGAMGSHNNGNGNGDLFSQDGTTIGSFGQSPSMIHSLSAVSERGFSSALFNSDSLLQYSAEALGNSNNNNNNGTSLLSSSIKSSKGTPMNAAPGSPIKNRTTSFSDSNNSNNENVLNNNNNNLFVPTKGFEMIPNKNLSDKNSRSPTSSLTLSLAKFEQRVKDNEEQTVRGRIDDDKVNDDASDKQNQSISEQATTTVPNNNNNNNQKSDASSASGLVENTLLSHGLPPKSRDNNRINDSDNISSLSTSVEHSRDRSIDMMSARKMSLSNQSSSISSGNLFDDQKLNIQPISTTKARSFSFPQAPPPRLNFDKSDLDYELMGIKENELGSMVSSITRDIDEDISRSLSAMNLANDSRRVSMLSSSTSTNSTSRNSSFFVNQSSGNNGNVMDHGLSSYAGPVSQYSQQQQQQGQQQVLHAMQSSNDFGNDYNNLAMKPPNNPNMYTPNTSKYSTPLTMSKQSSSSGFVGIPNNNQSVVNGNGISNVNTVNPIIKASPHCVNGVIIINGTNGNNVATPLHLGPNSTISLATVQMHMSMNGINITGNDQNPPCNTLYIGNLPNDTLEDELRQLFQRCIGYKRLCFKTRVGSPMCFVEFEDVLYATKSLCEMYGTMLSNSTRGGIRLSFSKNPLGVRLNNNTGNQQQQQQQQQHMQNGNMGVMSYASVSSGNITSTPSLLSPGAGNPQNSNNGYFGYMSSPNQVSMMDSTALNNLQQQQQQQQQNGGKSNNYIVSPNGVNSQRSMPNINNSRSPMKSPSKMSPFMNMINAGAALDPNTMASAGYGGTTAPAAGTLGEEILLRPN